MYNLFKKWTLTGKLCLYIIVKCLRINFKVSYKCFGLVDFKFDRQICPLENGVIGMRINTNIGVKGDHRSNLQYQWKQTEAACGVFENHTGPLDKQLLSKVCFHCMAHSTWFQWGSDVIPPTTWYCWYNENKFGQINIDLVLIPRLKWCLRSIAVWYGTNNI